MARERRSSGTEATLFGDAEPRPARVRPKAKAPQPAQPPREPASGHFAQVALDRPIDCEFTYRVSEAQSAGVRPGVRVAVPFGTSREIGVVTSLSESCDLDPRRLREIARVLDAEPLVSEELQRL